MGAERLSGCRFIINRLGVATVVPQQSSAVHGILWDIAGSDEDSPDDYEGVDEGLHYKGWPPVEGEGGEASRVPTYTAGESEPGGFREGYVGRLVAAGRRHGRPEDYIDGPTPWMSDRVPLLTFLKATPCGTMPL